MEVKTMNECAKVCEESNCCPWIISIVKGKEIARKCAEYVNMQCRRKAKKIISLSYDPPGILPEWENFEVNKTGLAGKIELLKNICKNPRPIGNSKNLIIIYGNPGTGKTMALQCALLDMIRRNFWVGYADAPVLRQAWLFENNTNIEDSNPDAARLKEVMRMVKNSPIFLIDELGNEGISKTAHFETRLRGIIDGKELIICAANKKKEEIYGCYSEPWTHSRLDGAYWIPWLGEDYRRKKK
jgi:DNA replication protein DnaC